MPKQVPTKVCQRCTQMGRKAEHNLSDFYTGSDGRPLPGCKTCRKEMARDYYKKEKAAEKAAMRAADSPPKSGKRVSPFAALSAPRTLVVVTGPDAPPIAVWRCMSCWKKATTRATNGTNPPFPIAWRRMSPIIDGKERIVNLCGPCSTLLLRARRILERITDRVHAEDRS